jgi:hypothetical protein
MYSGNSNIRTLPVNATWAHNENTEPVHAGAPATRADDPAGRPTA